MTIFVDASALISIIAGESDADSQADLLDQHAERYTSPIAIWETVAGLCRSYGLGVEQSRRLVDSFLAEARIESAPIDGAIGAAALDAYARYGKGRHKAALNMGDCFAYAGATCLQASLLYKGDDFDATDQARRPATTKR